MWKRWAVCPMRCGTKTAECFLWSGLCGRDFGPRDTDALRMIGALLCQSAAGEGRVGRHRRDDAALRMGRLRAAALRVLTEERIFLAEFDCEHVRNIPTFDWAFLERSSFTTFCHRKVVPKVSARRKRRGTAVGLRLKRYADKLAPAFSPAHPPPVLLPAFSQGGSCGALRATIKRMSPFIVCAARNHDHLVAFRFGRPAIFRRDGCLSSGSS